MTHVRYPACSSLPLLIVIRLLSLLLALALPALAWGQEALPDRLLAGMGPDGAAYVYHTARMLGSDGVVIERRGPGGQWTPLTDQPMTATRDGLAFEEALGEAYGFVADGLSAGTPQQTLSALRGNRFAASLYAVLYPSAADALGRRAPDPAARSGETVRYRLRRVDGSGAASSQPLELTHTYRPSAIAPAQGLRSELDERTIRLRWTYPQNAQERDQVYQFRVYRVVQPDAAGEVGAEERVLALAPVVRNDATRDYVVTLESEVELGQSETFEVVPLHLTGAPGPGTRIVVQLRDMEPPPPAQPVVDLVQSADPRADALVVRWTPTEAPDATGYHVYRRRSVVQTDPGERLTRLPLELSQTTFRDTTAERGTYFYAVGVLDASGNESARTLWPGETLIDRVAPAAAQSLTPRLLPSGAIAATWQPSPSPDVERYMVWRQRDGLLGLNRLTDEATGTRFVDSGVDGSGFREGERYRYALAAVDSSGNVSDTLYAALFVPDLTPPDPPPTFEALLTEGGRVAVTWRESPSTDVTGYRIRSAALALDTLLGDQTAFEGAYLSGADQTDQTLDFAVTAVDAAGNESAPQEARLELRDTAPPRAVRGVRAALGAQAVVVTWEPVPTGVATYRVSRAPSPAGPFEVIATLGAAAARYRDATPGGAERWYRVTAVDASGNASESPHSTRAQ